MERRLYAILIGNSEFPIDPKLPPLRCPPNDLEAMSRVLGSERHGPYEIIVLADKTHSEIRQVLYKVLQGARQEDRVVIYYTGHGKLNDHDGELFLATRDTDSSSLPISSLAAKDIRSFMDWSASREVILILDCCFSGAIGKAFKGDATEQAEQNLRNMARAEGRYILTASTASQVAEERPQDANGLLTKHIVVGIEQGAADRDDDGKVSMAELLRYVSEEVRKEGKQKPRGYFVGAEGELILATTGRPARDNKRNAITDRLFELRAKNYIRPSVIGSILYLVDSDIPNELQPVAYDFMDKLHRACEDATRFQELIHRIPTVFERSLYQTSAEAENLRREHDLAKAENRSLKETIANLSSRMETVSRHLEEALRATELATASVGTAEEKASRLADEVARLTAELSEARKAEERNSDILAAVNSDLADAAMANREHQARIRTLEAELTSVKNELKTAKQSLKPPPEGQHTGVNRYGVIVSPAAEAIRSNQLELKRLEESAKMATKKEPAKPAPENKREQVKSILKSYALGSSFYLWPFVPKRREAGARKAMRIPESEPILGLIDATLFGSAKDGIAFTEKGLYFRNFSEDPGQIPYERLKVDRTPMGKVLVKNGGKKMELELGGTGISDQRLYEILQELKKLCTK